MADPNWFLKTVGAPRAWQMVFGGRLIDADAADFDAVGRFDWGDVRVGHADLGYTRNPATKRALKVELGRNFMDKDKADPRDPMDYDETFGVRGHGCRTGSVIAGEDRAGRYLGVAPGVPLVPYRVSNRSVLNLPGGTMDEPEATHLARAIRHAVDENGCQVISVSLGSLVGWPAMGAAIDHAYDRGVIVVAAGGQVVHEVVYPAKYRQTIGVGGVRPGNGAYWTYRGSAAVQPDIWAPGEEVWRAAAAPPDDGSRVYRYGFGAGTSYATAVVAGLAALFLRKYGHALDAKGYLGWRRVELFRALLPRNSRSVRGSQAGRVVFFPGVLNDFPAWPAAASLRRAEGRAEDMRL